MSSCSVEESEFSLMGQKIAVYYFNLSSHMFSFSKRHFRNFIPKTVWKQSFSKSTNPAKLCGDIEKSQQVLATFLDSFPGSHWFRLQLWHIAGSKVTL